MVAEGDARADVGVDAKEGICTDRDGGFLQRKTRVGHVVGAGTQVGSGIENGVVTNGDHAQTIQNAAGTDPNMIAEGQMPGNGDLDGSSQSAIFADPASETTDKCWSAGGNEMPEGTGKGAPGQSDKFFFGGPDRSTDGRRGCWGRWGCWGHRGLCGCIGHG